MDSGTLVAHQAILQSGNSANLQQTLPGLAIYKLNNWHRNECLLTCIQCPYLNFNSFIIPQGILFKAQIVP